MVFHGSQRVHCTPPTLKSFISIRQTSTLIRKTSGVLDAACALLCELRLLVFRNYSKNWDLLLVDSSQANAKKQTPNFFLTRFVLPLLVTNIASNSKNADLLGLVYAVA